MAGALVQRQRGGPVGHGPLRDHGALQLQLPPLLAQLQGVPENLVLLAVVRRLTEVRLQLGNALAQGGVFIQQGRGVPVVVLLVVEPGGHGGVGRAEGGDQHVHRVYQRGGGGAEIGHQRQGHGDDRSGEQDPQAVVFQEIPQFLIPHS